MMKTPSRMAEAFSETRERVHSAWPCVLSRGLKAGYTGAATIGRWDRCDKILPHILRLRQEFEALDPTDKNLIASYELALLFEEAAC